MPPKREPFNLGFNLRDITSQVSILQEKLALAKRNGNVQEMEILIKQITHSEEARVLAVHRVVVNKGYRSPGLSKDKLSTIADYRAMVDKLGYIVKYPSSYKASPLDRIYIPKPQGGQRPISIPSYLDRCVQSLYKMVVEPIAEETSDLSSFGFRPIRSIAWAAGRVLNCLNNPLAKYNYAISFDIAKYFDKISHATILEKTKGIVPLQITQEWLACGYIDRETTQFFPTVEGTPQGGVLSPTLGNTVLDGLEQFIKDITNNHTSKDVKDRGGAFVRYA